MTSSATERERNLWIASKRYIIGEISREELEVVEQVEAEYLKNAIRVFAQYRTNLDLLGIFLKFKKKKSMPIAA